MKIIHSKTDDGSVVTVLPTVTNPVTILRDCKFSIPHDERETKSELRQKTSFKQYHTTIVQIA